MSESNKIAVNNSRRENQKQKGVSQNILKPSTQLNDNQRNLRAQNPNMGGANPYKGNKKLINDEKLTFKSKESDQNITQSLCPENLGQNPFNFLNQNLTYQGNLQANENNQFNQNYYQMGGNQNHNQMMQQSLQQMEQQANTCYSENLQICSESGENQGNQEEFFNINSNHQFAEMNQNDAQEAFMQQLMLQSGFVNPSANEIQEFWKNQQKNFLKQQTGNQLKQFALQMFKSLSKLELKKLYQKAKTYFEQQQQADDLEIQKNNQEEQNDSSNDSNQSEPHQIYLDEVQKAISKHPELSENFMRFVTPQYEAESEQVFAEFFIQNPLLINFYIYLAHQYSYFLHNDNQQELYKIGSDIFNLIMPYAQQTDPRLIQLIPIETLDLFKIDYESNGFIKSWQYIGDQLNSDDYSSQETQTQNSRQYLNESSQIHQNSSSNRNNSTIQSIKQSVMDSNNIEQPIDSQDTSDNQQEQSIDDENTENHMFNKKQKFSSSYNLYGIPGTNIIPQSALTGKNKSLQIQFNIQHQNQKSLNKHELKTFDNFFKTLKDEKDWISFCKLFKLYFDGVISLREFFNLYDCKFQSKVKQEVKDEIEKLIPTREQNRRAQSQLLNPWNDLDNQAFEKIPDSSYYKIEDKFPIPTCTGKMLNQIYLLNINDRYLSLATGSEKTENSKFAFKNNYEEKIFQHEDKLYEYDTLIDNIRKSFKKVNQIFNDFMNLPEIEQNNYRFPVNSLNPLRLYWDSKFRKSIHEQFLKEGKILKEKDFVAFKKSLKDKLEFLKNQKNIHINDIKEQFRKNFTKSLDHKSFQYKQFKTQFLQKKFHLQKMKHLYEDNLQKKRILPYQISILFGSGEIPENSNYRFFNTFGKDFNKVFDVKRLQNLEKEPDHPIDLKFMQIIPTELLNKYQGKCPQARFIMNDKRTFETTIKLILQSIRLQNFSHHSSTQTMLEKEQQISALKFMLEKLLMVDNFKEIEKQSENIQQLTPKLVDILMNSLQYYQLKYDGELETMQEIFQIDQNEIKDIQPSNDENFKQNQSVHEKISSQEQQKMQIQQNNNQNTIFEQIRIQKMIQNSDDKIQIQNKISQFQNLKENEKQDLIKYLEDEMQQNMFIPSFNKNQNDAEANKDYKLMYGSLNIYMFVLFFYSIYERLLKAQDLVRAKLEQDFLDDFSQKDWASKFDNKIQNLIDERFQYLVKAIVSTLNLQNNTFDSGKYEDLARELLGNEAYLLFQVDKLIKSCSQQLIHFQTDVYCKVSQNIFNDFEKCKVKKESAYLARFYQEANESQNHQQINGQKQAASQAQITGAAANNKDNHNPPINQSAFRLMFSPCSKILTAHYICLNPFSFGDQKAIQNGNQFSLQNQAQESLSSGYLKFLIDYTQKDSKEENDSDKLQVDEKQIEDEESNKNKISPQFQPIFLKRNLLKMKRIRQNQKPLVNKNGMILHLIPLVQQLHYEINTQDIIIFKRNNFQENKNFSDEKPSNLSKTASIVSSGKLKGKKSILGKRKAATAIDDLQLKNQNSETKEMINFSIKDLQKQLQYNKVMNKRVSQHLQRQNESSNRRQMLPQNFINQRNEDNRQNLDSDICVLIEQDDEKVYENLSDQIEDNKVQGTQNYSQVVNKNMNSSEQTKTRNSLGRQCKQSNEKQNSLLNASFTNCQNNLFDKNKPIKVSQLNTQNRFKNI